MLSIKWPRVLDSVELLNYLLKLKVLKLIVYKDKRHTGQHNVIDVWGNAFASYGEKLKQVLFYRAFAYNINISFNMIVPGALKRTDIWNRKKKRKIPDENVKILNKRKK